MYKHIVFLHAGTKEKKTSRKGLFFNTYFFISIIINKIMNKHIVISCMLSPPHMLCKERIKK
jgi:hypothetical protein